MHAVYVSAFIAGSRYAENSLRPLGRSANLGWRVQEPSERPMAAGLMVGMGRSLVFYIALGQNFREHSGGGGEREVEAIVVG